MKRLLLAGTKKARVVPRLKPTYSFKWLTDRDSNPNKRCQKPLCYHYTIGQYLKALILGLSAALSRRFFIYRRNRFGSGGGRLSLLLTSLRCVSTFFTKCRNQTPIFSKDFTTGLSLGLKSRKVCGLWRFSRSRSRRFFRFRPTYC